MKLVLGFATLTLALLALEERGRKVASDALGTAAEVSNQARETTKTLGRRIDQQPLAALVIASVCGFFLARVARSV